MTPKEKLLLSRSNTEASKKTAWVGSLILFILLLVCYIVISNIRHIDNPQDKIVPSLLQLGQGIKNSLSPNEAGVIPLLVDTTSSLARFFVGLILATLVGIFFGVILGIFPLVESLFARFILYFDKIPPLALLPIIFIFSGLGESTKILLIVIGVSPSIILDIYLHVKAFPKEQIIKAITLGANKYKIITKVILPQISPIIINIVRLNLINVWLFLIAAESIAASEGLGYRIFLVRRYLAMDIIIPYVLWIALLSFLIDNMLAKIVEYKYHWYNK